MSYQKQEFIDNQTILTAGMMDHIEDGIVANETRQDNANASMNKLTEIQSSDVVSSQMWVQGTYNDSGTAVASTTNLRMYGVTPSNLVVKVDVSGDYKYKIFRFNASDMTLVDKTEWILPDDDPVCISVDKTQNANVVVSRLDEATIDISEASNVVVHLLYGNEYYSNVAETTGKNLIHYRMFNVNDGGANISFNDETESVIVTAVGNTDYQCAQFYLNELQQICKVGHQYRLSYEAEVLSGTPYILMSVRGANGSPNSRVRSAGPGSAAPSGTYGFTFTMNEYMGRIMAQVSETANNPGASVRYYNISLQEIMPDTAVDDVVREKVEETKGNEVALYPDMWFEFGGVYASDGRIYNGDATYMAMNRRTANYVKVDHDGYIYFKNPDASKFNLRIVQYNLDYTVRETQGLAHIETFCFMNSSDVMYKIQISARYTDTEMPTLSDCHVGVYYPVQFISGIGSSEPKNTYCIMTHNIGQWTTGSGTKMTDNVHSWIDLHDAIIKRYSPDVLCLQEYLPYESITGDYYENSYTFNSPNNNVYSGKCILSNMPLENSTGGVYSNQASGNIACNWAKSYVWLGGHKVAIITTHLSTTLEKAQLQNAELKALADNEEYVIICGDFNVPCTATTDTNYINFFKPWVDAGYRMANGGQFGFMPTFYATSSVAKEDGLCIDYIITSGNLNVSFACVDYQKYDAAIDTKIDHMPLVAYVSLSDDVRYDVAQTLTDAQKMTARENIGAASQADKTAILDAGCYVDWGWVSGEQAATVAGVTVTRNGNRVKLNGVSTGNFFVRMVGDLLTLTSDPTAAQRIAGCHTIAGHEYQYQMRLLSGSAELNTAHIVQHLIAVGSYKSNSADSFPNHHAQRIEEEGWELRDFTSDDGADLSVWLWVSKTAAFTNAEYELTLLDVTAVKQTDYATTMAKAALTAKLGALPVEAYGKPGSIMTMNKVRVSKSWGNRVRVDAVGNDGTYSMVSIQNGVNFLGAWNLSNDMVEYELKANHAYRFTAKYISGTTEQVGNADSIIMLFYKGDSGATPSTAYFTEKMNAQINGGVTEWEIVKSFDEPTKIGFGFYFRGMAADALTIEFLCEEEQLAGMDTAMAVAGSPYSVADYGIPYMGTISGGGSVEKTGNTAIISGTNTSTTSRVMKFSGDSFYVNGSATENSAHTTGHHDLLPGRTYRLTMRVLSGTIDYVNTTNLRNNRFDLSVYNYATGATSGTYLSGRLSDLINDAKYEAATTYSETAAYYKRVVQAYSSGDNINFEAVSVYAESGTTATRTYAADDYIAAGTTLYKATASIASGDTLAEGVNVVVPDDLYTEKKGSAYPITCSVVRTFTDKVRVGFCMYITGQQRWNDLTVDWAVEDITANGAVQYVQQTLTDTQKTTARENIEAASTTEIAAIEGSAADALSVKAYGPQFTDTDYGITITKSGRRVTLNGTRTGSSFRCVSVTNGKVATNNDSPTVNHVNQDAVLYAGRTYVIWFRIISGTYSQGSNNCGVWMFTYDGTTPHSPAISSNLLETINGGGYASIRRTPTTDMKVGFGFYFRTGVSFSNLVIEFGVQDITENTVIYTASAPTITASAGVRYICSAAYVTSLSFTPSETGICSVRFTSGTTPTVLTLPSTVKMPDWWTGVEANRTYEISIEDGIYGVVTSWT